MNTKSWAKRMMTTATGILVAYGCSAILGVEQLGETADFYLNRSFCGETASCAISCETVENSLLWFHTERPAPPLEPAAAFEISGKAVSSEFGEYSEPYAESLSLFRCGKGWVYVVSYSASAYCSDTSTSDYGTIAVGVFMDGTTFFPPENSFLESATKCSVQKADDQSKSTAETGAAPDNLERN